MRNRNGDAVMSVSKHDKTDKPTDAELKYNPRISAWSLQRRGARRHGDP